MTVHVPGRPWSLDPLIGEARRRMRRRRLLAVVCVLTAIVTAGAAVSFQSRRARSPAGRTFRTGFRRRRRIAAASRSSVARRPSGAGGLRAGDAGRCRMPERAGVAGERGRHRQTRRRAGDAAVRGASRAQWRGSPGRGRPGSRFEVLAARGWLRSCRLGTQHGRLGLPAARRGWSEPLSAYVRRRASPPGLGPLGRHPLTPSQPLTTPLALRFRCGR